MTRSSGRLWWVYAILMAVAAIRSIPSNAENAPAARIGEVWVQSQAAIADYHNALVDGLRDLGYAEGQNLVLLTRYANGDESPVPQLIHEMLTLKVDVLFVSQAAVSAAQKATSTIPIVCATMNDPVGAGQLRACLVRDITSPGSPGNRWTPPPSGWKCYWS